LGMTFDFKVRGKCKVTMDGYIDECLEEMKVFSGVSDTPAVGELFDIDVSSKLLGKDERELFHSIVAKWQYLGKRVRPDILVTVSFLVKRVLTPTQQDWRKLMKLIRYIRHTRELDLTLEFDKNVNVIAYIDVSYGVHANKRLHTGSTISLGKGSAYAKSTAQKINTKSSTEAELVSLSDSTGQVIWTRHFLEAQEYKMDAAKVWQDNMSTIAMIKNGKPTSDATRHIDIRYFWIRVSTGDLKVDYMSTLSVVADILTKPITDVALFGKLRYMVLNN
jgi:hypothetical protein